MEPLLKGIDWERFGRDFLNHYVRGGFGRLPKRDIDVLVVYLLLEHGTLDQHSDWELARLLGTTPTRIRNLRSDARFLYWNDAQRDAHVRRTFFQALANEGFTVSGTIVTLQLPDPFVRQALVATLMDAHQVVDTSFNGALLKMGPAGFGVLFEALLDPEQYAVLRADPKVQEALARQPLTALVQKAVVASTADGLRSLNRAALLGLSEAAMTHGPALVTAFTTLVF